MKDTSGENNQNKDYRNKYNICQIILQFELVYIFKFFIFIFVCYTVFIDTSLFDTSNLEIDKQHLLTGILTFVLSVVLDCVVLTKSVSSKIKGSINRIHLVYTLVMGIGALFIVLVFWGKIPFSLTSAYTCNFFAVSCCGGPFIELGYDTICHLKNEENNQY